MDVVTIDMGFLATVLGVLATITGFIVAVYKICQRFSKMEQKIEHSGRTHRVLMEGLYACLDGLHQQGCNGEVTKALGALHKHLFEELEQ